MFLSNIKSNIAGYKFTEKKFESDVLSICLNMSLKQYFIIHLNLQKFLIFS